MAITKKTLITFVFTIIFIVSSVHCLTTASAVTPDNGYGEIKSEICTSFMSPCTWLVRYSSPDAICNQICMRDKNKPGHCVHKKCCCIF
ncbi:hypothetical protein Bca4012_034490 [Brassica carinata]